MPEGTWLKYGRAQHPPGPNYLRVGVALGARSLRHAATRTLKPPRLADGGRAITPQTKHLSKASRTAGTRHQATYAHITPPWPPRPPRPACAPRRRFLEGNVSPHQDSASQKVREAARSRTGHAGRRRGPPAAEESDPSSRPSSAPTPRAARRHRARRVVRWASPAARGLLQLGAPLLGGAWRGLCAGCAPSACASAVLR